MSEMKHSAFRFLSVSVPIVKIFLSVTNLVNILLYCLGKKFKVVQNYATCQEGVQGKHR